MSYIVGNLRKHARILRAAGATDLPLDLERAANQIEHLESVIQTISLPKKEEKSDGKS